MSYPVPQIIYDPGTGPVTLALTFPPKGKAGVHERDTSGQVIGAGGQGTRADSITLSGLQQSQWFRTDQFLTLQLEYVPQNSDIVLWDDFIAYAMTGGQFDYYPDATVGTFATYTLEETDWNPEFAFSAPDPTYLGIDKFSIKMRLVVSGGSSSAPAPTIVTTTPAPGPPPVPPSGSGITPEDMQDWVLMDNTGSGGSPDRTSQHLEGTNLAGALTKYYSFLDTSTSVHKIWQIKNTVMNPWDVLLVDGSFLYHWITEIAPFWSVANDFKRINASHGYPTAQGVPVMPRYFTPGVVGTPSQVTITVPKPNPQNDFIACVSQPAIELGDFQSVTSGLYSANFGGSLGTQNYILVQVYRGKIGSFKVRENFYYVKQWGFVKWEAQSLIGGVWTTTNSSVHNTIVAGGSSGPNFPCGFAFAWWI